MFAMSTKSDTSIASIVSLFRERGQLSYDGEGITQLQHAWQCGCLAEAANASLSLQLAAWLHDLGHLMTPLEGSPTTRGIDDTHEHLASVALEPLFGAAVARPIALHVAAKRYLVATNATYFERLSPDSRRSLSLQGGAMNEEEQIAFSADPHFEDALRVRTWDDIGKQTKWRAESTSVAIATLESLMRKVSSDNT